MAFNIYDENLTRVGTIQTIVSSVWEEQYSDRGICQLVVAISPEASQLLTENRFVGQPNKKTLWQIKTREKRDGNLWVSGFTANYTLLEDRVYEGLHVSDNVEQDLRDAVLSQRPANIVGLAPERGLIGSSVSEHTYPDLFKLAKDLCGIPEYGFTFIHDRTARKLLFDVYEGTEKPNAKFSERWGNLANLELLQSSTDFKNVAYVGGAGEGFERVFVICGATETKDLQRHELFVDARDIRREEGQSEDAYKALLRERGLQKLNEHNKKLNVTFDVAPENFDKDYSLGDIIYCVLPDDGLKLFVRVIAFEEVIENNKTRLAITIGSPILQTAGGKT